MKSPSAHPSFELSPLSAPSRRSRAAGRSRAPARTGSLVETLEDRQLLTTLPSGFTESRIGTFGFTSPTAMAMAPDGRIFVAEQAGQLMVVKDGQLLPTPFLTVNTTDENERGLFGVVLDPNFETNGYVYVSYTNLEGTIHTRLSRFTASGDVAAPGSETTIFETGPMTVSIHNSGALHFGPDGKLYMTVGENGGGPAAGVLTSYKGKMMRINPDGSIPTDNPFYNQTTGIQQAIYAYGFRNTFSFAIQPGTGRIFANDVGTNVWEEINDVVAGGNYGYPAVEGPTNDPQYVSPVYAYQHSPGCAIVGGDFYNPATVNFPADYVGDYFFGDLCDRTISRINPDTKEVTVFAQFTRGRIIDIDTAPDGSLYYLLRPLEGIYPGGIYKASFNSTSPGAPAIGEQPQNKVGSLGQPVTFSVAASGNEPLNYQWQRNGTNIPGATQPNYTIPAVTQADDGASFRVVVTNAVGSVTSSAVTLTVTTNQPPVPTITLPAAGATFSAGDTINFAGDATDPEDGVLPASAFTWRVDLYHADTPETQHAHPVLAPTTGSKSGSIVADLAGHYETSIWMRVTLTVKDSAGLEATTFADVQPNKVTMTLGASAPGLRLDLDGRSEERRVGKECRSRWSPYH